LPFFVHYGNSPDFTATARAVLANADVDKRIDAEIENGVLKLKTQGGEYTQSLLVNTFVSDVVFNAVLVGWLLSMVHTGFLWKDYMYDRMAKKRARNAEEEQLRTDGEKNLCQ